VGLRPCVLTERPPEKCLWLFLPLRNASRFYFVRKQSGWSLPDRNAQKAIVPTQREIFFDDHDIIVSKTDLKSRLTDASRMFCSSAGYAERDVIGQPHSLIRHPDMPRAVFKLLWDAIQDKREIFASVKNMARNGDHDWVFAHMTPSFDKNRAVCGFHSTAPCAGDFDPHIRLTQRTSYVDFGSGGRHRRPRRDRARTDVIRPGPLLRLPDDAGARLDPISPGP